MEAGDGKIAFIAAYRLMTRSSFLRKLGLGSLVAPTAVKMVISDRPCVRGKSPALPSLNNLTISYAYMTHEMLKQEDWNFAAPTDYSIAQMNAKEFQEFVNRLISEHYSPAPNAMPGIRLEAPRMS